MQSASSRIWTRVLVHISYDDNYYTTSISTNVGYLMPNPLYTYILNIYDLVGLSFMAYKP